MSYKDQIWWVGKVGKVTPHRKSSLEYESMWIEIKNKKSKNIVIASIYRHPHNNFKEYFQYLEKCLSVVAQENKDLYMW